MTAQTAQPSIAQPAAHRTIAVVTDNGSQARKPPRAVRNLGRRSAPQPRRNWLDKVETIVHLAIWTS
jgi:hypothetical protein